MHDLIDKVLHDSEFLKSRSILYHLLLHLLMLVTFVVVYTDRDLICVIIEVDEAVVQKETTVALFAIAIVDLLATLNIIHRLYDKPSAIISVVPSRLPRSFVI